LAIAAKVDLFCPFQRFAPFRLQAGEGAELGAEGGAGESEEIGGVGLEAAGGFHHGGQHEGVELLDQMTVEFRLFGPEAIFQDVGQRIPVGRSRRPDERGNFFVGRR